MKQETLVSNNGHKMNPKRENLLRSDQVISDLIKKIEKYFRNTGSKLLEVLNYWTNITLARQCV